MVDKYNIEDYKKVGQEIYDKLHLATYPVAIKYYKHKSEVPQNVIRPSVSGKQMSICQTFPDRLHSASIWKLDVSLGTGD